MAIILFVGLCAVVIDVSWYWANSLRMQRAADAAALAGVVWLPGNVDRRPSTVARAEAAKNGYTNGVSGVVRHADPGPDEQPTPQGHASSGDVGTFFARVLGISTVARHRRLEGGVRPARARWAARRTTTACSARSATPAAASRTVTTNTFNDVTTSWFSAGIVKRTTAWTTPANAYTTNDAWATSITANQYQQWGDFDDHPRRHGHEHRRHRGPAPR